MAAVLTYTTYEDVRAVLGISDDDLEDAALDLGVYAGDLYLALTEISEDLPALYVTKKAIAEGSRTSDEQKFVLLVSRFATYQVARQSGAAILMGAQKITDGKAEMARFTSSPYKDLLDRVEAEYARVRRLLENVFATLTGGDTVANPAATLLVGAKPAVDRVTNA